MTIDQVDDQWREQVDAELARRGWTRKALAEKVGCHPSTINALLQRGVPALSRSAGPISEALDIPPPSDRSTALPGSPQLSVVPAEEPVFDITNQPHDLGPALEADIEELLKFVEQRGWPTARATAVVGGWMALYFGAIVDRTECLRQLTAFEEALHARIAVLRNGR